MSDVSYEIRNSLVDRSTTYTLTSEAIVWSRDGSERRMTLSDIARIELISYTGGGGEALQCKVRAKDGTRLMLRSQHYLSLGNFEDRREGYARFLGELLRRVAIAAPDAACVAGSTMLNVLWIVVALIFAAAGFMVLMIVFAGDAANGFAMWGYVAFLVVGAPFVYRQLRRGGARRFDPADPPRDLLGAGAPA